VSESADFPAGCAFVTAGGGGVGGAICTALARQGADVVLTYRASREAAEAAAQAVRAHGRAAHLLQLDLTDAAAVRQALVKAAELAGQIHTVVYAAGPQLPFKFLSQVEPAEMGRFLEADTLAFFNLIHAALPHLRRSRGSAVAIHTTGLYRWPAKDGLSVVPKAGVESMIKGFAREEGRMGVRVNGVALGVLDGGLFEKMKATGDIDQRFVDATIAAVPLGRLGRLEEVAEAACFLASAKAAYITGHSIVVDGGFHI
jgi:NAD(P)-dependent dehydrogenase (short-subunit alcohol dehydrogenase family)